MVGDSLLIDSNCSNDGLLVVLREQPVALISKHYF